jgi:hypothetical protein
MEAFVADTQTAFRGINQRDGGEKTSPQTRIGQPAFNKKN